MTKKKLEKEISILDERLQEANDNIAQLIKKIEDLEKEIDDPRAEMLAKITTAINRALK